MKRCSTIILRCAVIFAGVIMLATCGAIAWIVFFENKPDPYHMTYIWLIGTYAAAIPYFIALDQAMKLLKYIDIGCAFSKLSLKSLNIITRCAIVVFIVVTIGGLPFFYTLVQLNTDTPGFVLLGLLISGSTFLIVVFTSVLKRLLQDAIDVKSENDLTI
ncbi:DUF2975 domain-containing protein [Oenococcus sp. UCMA 16435]|nr:DUF2975 domain-containing protein [Oenococcus sp. UCMA 16435]MDI4584633.1 DUF2975 domain-containing protein [Oenococcus sp. UCMA 14587]MDN6968259.1 DUF2975 domain-containing protein [Oenococcus sp. UCMA 17063]